jgi:hypothetical protein
MKLELHSLSCVLNYIIKKKAVIKINLITLALCKPKTT